MHSSNKNNKITTLVNLFKEGNMRAVIPQAIEIIEECNSHRLYSYLGYKSPNQFEMEMKIPRLELQKAS
jgi:hypothetical protein